MIIHGRDDTFFIWIHEETFYLKFKHYTLVARGLD